MTQVKRKARPKTGDRKKEPRYLIHCGDSWNTFTFGGLWKLSHVEGRLNELLSKIEFVPGLVLKDAGGHLFKPVLQVHLAPIEEITNA